LKLGNRIVISMPMHPLMFAVYGFLLFPLFLYSPVVFASLSSYLGIPQSVAIAIGLTFPTLTFPLSLVNIVIKRIETGEAYFSLTSKYVNYFGIPIPVFVPVLQKREIVIAVNMGGAVLPLSFSLLLLVSLGRSSQTLLLKALADILLTSIVTFLTSRAMPGVGIVTHSLIPPLTSTAVALLLQAGSYSFPIAYIGGVMGSLIGADILRLAKDFEKFRSEFGSVFLSIGGAGTFDGIFLSGIFAAVLSAIF